MAPQRPIYVCYIVRCAGGTLYTGVTTDIGRRLEEHNAGNGARYTASRRPVRLVWTEAHPDRAAAQRREAQIQALESAQEIGIVRRRPEVDVIGHNRAGGRAVDVMNRWKERTDGCSRRELILTVGAARPGAWDWPWPGRGGAAVNGQRPRPSSRPCARIFRGRIETCGWPQPRLTRSACTPCARSRSTRSTARRGLVKTGTTRATRSSDWTCHSQCRPAILLRRRGRAKRDAS